MKKNIILALLIVIIINACNTVYTEEPIPSSDYDKLEYLPDFLIGDFQYENHHNGELVVLPSWNEMFPEYLLSNSYAVGKYQFFKYNAFTEDEFSEIVKKVKTEGASVGVSLQVKNDIMHIKMDTLIKLYNELISKDEKYLTDDEKGELEVLRECKDEGFFEKRFQLIKDGNRYIFNKSFLAEIDFASSEIAYMSGTYKFILKKYGNAYLFNVLLDDDVDNRANYVTFFIRNEGNEILFQVFSSACISSLHISTDNGLAKFEEIEEFEGGNMLISISDRELYRLLSQEDYFTTVRTLTPISEP